MGFRCPNCHKDFGNDCSLLQEHFESIEECRDSSIKELAYIDVTTKLASKPKKKKAVKQSKRQHSYIDENHCFVKASLVSNEDGSDDVECKNCGLKAKRYMKGMLKFDGRISYKRIENCNK